MKQETEEEIEGDNLFKLGANGVTILCPDASYHRRKRNRAGRTRSHHQYRKHHHSQHSIRFALPTILFKKYTLTNNQPYRT